MMLTRCCAALLLTVSAQVSAQTTDSTPTPVPPPVAIPSTAPVTPAAPAVPVPATPPTPPVAPLTSRLYAGASVAPSLSGNGTAYGIVVGSSQVFGSFGAQVAIDYVTSSGAISVDASLLYRLKLAGKLQPYAGGGLGLTSSAVTTPAPTGTTQTAATTTATDYAANLIVGSDYLLTDSIALSGEAMYRAAFSSKGSANGAGLRGRLGIKFLF
ncbi:hypothetical protein DKM44_09060 [Deinococcus irradiatisoli]|uniref:Outer membrane protein beta-barrel domain-containing protein n=1 Tax=Deinococcus irradiatisoli TaxID=2202254 RepID=A0A2Z3JKC3_9DEIO|nr:hypothetical protein [Deinococcus irradiatisoli]AWN23359.1 hypothetical protein DKM44_09060 [Deinococcus irradiatisoli]